MVFGFLFFIPFAFLAAIVLGHIALSEIKRSAGRLTGEGLAIAGLVLGYLWIAGIPVFLIFAAIAIPNLLRARMAANEASAVAGVRTLITAEISYAASHPEVGYTCSLSDLGAAGLISGELARGGKTGYALELRDCEPLAAGGGNAKFQVVAYPERPNQTGKRAFCAGEDGVIKADPDGSASGCLENGEVLR
jgi:type IV pilus assembly protein PilA